MAEAGFSMVLPLLLLVSVLAAAAAGIDRMLRTRDGEGLFWTGLTAFLAVLLTAAWAVTATSAGSAAVGMVVVAGGIAASFWTLRRDRRRRRNRETRQVEAAVTAAATRHREVLARWSAYELDPWLAAEHPQLLDVRTPETRTFIRALKAAEQLRPDGVTAAQAAAYAEAVTTLEDSLRRAEEAAGGGRAA
ncbi:hypothetical protein N2K95_00615 [Arthrobacter zhaoxinii]|uniref:DUF4129 domain-containing protein n=1 Tax=Arthrobacter zhaoxinii TaxID=2964616 RepID=A0ABY5YTB9_9MICC|nr:hypothetical protein [Arthrobacter zhaoxinii]UWX97249.1 hypothetical protein N2K95_00615 [Arthrobacter zhaoxinii]